jgi:dephospho-CoA kinase
MIGITGPMGAGKSTVSAMLGDLGATVVDADAIVRQLQRPSEEGYARILEIFGRDVLGPDGEIDRRLLAAQVFGDAGKLAALEAALHPLVVDRVSRARDMLGDDDVLVVEAIKLLGSAMRHSYDEIWVVLAPRSALLPRLRQRGLSEDDAQRRLANQATDQTFRAAADVVIENGADLSETRLHVQREWSRISTVLARRATG